MPTREDFMELLKYTNHLTNSTVDDLPICQTVSNIEIATYNLEKDFAIICIHLVSWIIPHNM